MNRVQRFEDLIAWQKARSLTKSIYHVTNRGAFQRDFGLSSQIQRAAVSIMSNIAEGFERSSLKEFHRYLTMAKSSWAEVRSQLYVAVDAGYLQDIHFHKVMREAQEVARIVSALRFSVFRKAETMSP